MRYFKFLLILIFCSATATAQTDSVYTLQQCIDIAIKNNLDVRQSELQMERRRIYYQQARENLLPTLSGNANHSINSGRSQTADLTYVNRQVFNGSYSLGSDVTVFNGLALINSIKQTSLDYQAGKLDYQQAKNNISLNVITTYLQVMNSQDQYTQSQNQLAVSQKTLERREILNKDGNVQPQDLYDLRGETAGSKINLVTSRSAIYSSKLDLFQIMNVPFDKEIALVRLTADELPGNYDLTASQVYNAAISQFAQIQAADLRVKSAEKGLAATKGYLYPSLGFNAGISTQYSSGSAGSYDNQIRNNYGTGVGLGLRIPILSNFRQRNQVSLAKIDLQNARYTSEATKVSLKQQIEKAHVQMTMAYERYQITAEQVAAFSESFRIADVKFNEGVLNSVDFLNAKVNMDRAKINLINARYDYFIRTKILDYYQGKMSF
ncbi:TolC family protein [Mucilaginibacter myungsuensis]|uniref:TolC family protein n=1 Tax=Mucilaginibacter myungsuensis TaxID=649104 RepID=A0A929KZR1_9SPHI|nr:TolC family protein [Mucilaginibacter myungsuensis]MBE9660646.1 TolC family protein [Mucilaginibacter myungsuensis]MDN3600691.1 TolC family protein [Mucilaginibacter myungsuensis]